MMPNLPNVNFERDMEQFRELFENPAFRMDGLKIYPTLVIRGTGMYNHYTHTHTHTHAHTHTRSIIYNHTHTRTHTLSLALAHR